MKGIVIFICLLGYYHLSGQEFKRHNVSAEERSKGIIEIYANEATETQGGLFQLYLYKSGYYQYKEQSLSGERYNNGRWEKKKGIIYFTDSVDQENLPISIQYLKEVDTIEGAIFKYVINKKGERLYNCLIRVNEDSVHCMPALGKCYGQFTRIHRIRLAFENGYRSKWMAIPRTDYSQLQVILLSNMTLDHYIPLRYKKFTVTEKGLLVSP